MLLQCHTSVTCASTSSCVYVSPSNYAVCPTSQGFQSHVLVNHANVPLKPMSCATAVEPSCSCSVKVPSLVPRQVRVFMSVPPALQCVQSVLGFKCMCLLIMQIFPSSPCHVPLPWSHHAFAMSQSRHLCLAKFVGLCQSLQFCSVSSQCWVSSACAC